MDLYSGDYMMIEETFADVVHEYPSLLEHIDAAYLAGDVSALRAAIHKIKPLFGFVGLISLQSQCLHFENTCEVASSVSSLNSEYTTLKNTLVAMKSIIEEEKEKLAFYNSR